MSFEIDRGGVAEWSKAAVLKTVVRASGPWVRILPPPHFFENQRTVWMNSSGRIRGSHSKLWVTGLKIFASLFSTITFVVSCEFQPDSDNLSEPEIFGYYLPNHNGAETLQVREDHIWVRIYYDSANTCFVDSGSWGFIDEKKTNYRIVMSNFFFRYPPWNKRFFWGLDTLGISDMAKYNSTYYCPLRKKRDKIRIILPYEYPSNFYEKQISSKS